MLFSHSCYVFRAQFYFRVFSWKMTSTRQCSVLGLAGPSTGGVPLKRARWDEQEEVVESPPPAPNGVDVKVRNVVCGFSVRCHIDLRKFGMSVCHVYYDRSKAVVAKQMRNPKCFVKVFNSGKVSIVGCQSEELAMAAARRIARLIQKVVPRAKFCDYRVSNILATCHLPFGVRVEKVNEDYPRETQYEPELNVGLIWRSEEPKATLRIYTTGSITITGATSSAGIITILESLYPILRNYQGPKVGDAQPAPEDDGFADSDIE